MPVNSSVELSDTSINMNNTNPSKQSTPDKVNVVDNSVKWIQMSNKTKIIAGIISFVILLIIILSSTLTQQSHHSDTNTQNNQPFYGSTSSTSDDGISFANDTYLEPVTDNTVNCNDKFPFGKPESYLITTNLIDICHSGYYSKYDPNAKIPLFTIYMITNQTIAGCIDRNKIRPVPSYKIDPNIIPSQSPHKNDYSSGSPEYQCGHMAPANDLAYNRTAFYESFYYTNLAPQTQQINKNGGMWTKLENSIRYWGYLQTIKGHNLQIIMGTYYTEKSQTIGANKVVIPDRFFKIIIDMMNLTQVYAFSFPKKTPTMNLNDYSVSISTIESNYKIKFLNYPINKNIVNTMPNAPQPYEYKKYKNAKCPNTN